jgi:hypothetical protein
MYFTPQKSPLPLATMSQIAEPVIPAKSACGGREPGSRNNETILESYWIPE